MIPSTLLTNTRRSFLFGCKRRAAASPAIDYGSRERRRDIDDTPAQVRQFQSIHVAACTPLCWDDSNLVRRQYHTTLATERLPVAMLTFGAVAATAKAGQYAVQGYNEWKKASEEAEQAAQKEKEERMAQGIDVDSEEKDKSAEKDQSQQAQKNDGKRENIFASFFNLSVGAKYYEGGFEEQMTRKEAALILGVRESSASKRIKEAHRKLLILNHPDTGGSTYMAGKINEAKELLLKGKK